MEINLEQAKLDPESIFREVSEVLENKELSKKQKIDILERWKYDENELAVAEEENMPSTNTDARNKLDEILEALLQLGASDDPEKHPPTKHGD